MSSVNSLFHFLRRRYKDFEQQRERRAYLTGGRLPWTAGYWTFRNHYIRDVLAAPDRLAAFTVPGSLPPNYGERLDERTVEYPWALARVGTGGGRLLDAGSTLNFDFLLDHASLREKSIVITTLAPEGFIERPNVSYLYGDLRDTILRDAIFDTIVCISTLEHIGMNNTMLYTADTRFKEADFFAYRAVLREFRRLLKPGGKLLLTVPYGRYEDHGWLQQFDAERVADVIDTFAPRTSQITYYRYLPDGWHLSTAAECADCRYFNIHTTRQHDPDYAAAARAVACIEATR